jgi:Icc-related predicted phosphoesterase
MNFKKLFSVGKASVIVLFGILITQFTFPLQTKAATSSNLIFGVVSDTHLQLSTSPEEDNLRKAFTKFKNSNIDVLIVAGDIANNGDSIAYDKFNRIFNEIFSDASTRPKKVLVMGNHDYWNDLSVADAQDLFTSKLGVPLNSSTIVNGYHFIGVNTENGETGGMFTNISKTFLKNELDKAVADDPKKPIFVTFHQPVKNTVYGSDAWGNASLDEVLKDYPQVVNFSGHSHYALEDERSIFQRDYTSVGTSSTSYTELESGKANGSVPPRAHECVQGLLVNVSNSAVTISREDFNNNLLIKNDWVINLPMNKANFNYTDARATTRTAPYFAPGSTMALTNVLKNSITGKVNATLTFTQAKDVDFVHSYRVQFINKNTSIVTKDFLLFSDFYLGLQKMAPSLTYVVTDIDPDTQYMIKINGIESYGKQSDVLAALATTANHGSILSTPSDTTASSAKSTSSGAKSNSTGTKTNSSGTTSGTNTNNTSNTAALGTSSVKGSGLTSDGSSDGQISSDVDSSAVTSSQLATTTDGNSQKPESNTGIIILVIAILVLVAIGVTFILYKKKIIKFK